MNKKNISNDNVISKDKIKTIIIVVLICIIVFGGSFLASEISNYKKEIAELNDITNNFNKIDIEGYASLFKGSELSLIFIGKSDCPYSSAENNVFIEVMDNYRIDVNYLNLDDMDNDAIDILYSSYEAFEEGISTPTIMIVQNKEVKLFQRGYTSKDDLIELLKEVGYIVE